ncbi:MAG: hypothetical protein GEU90_08680 [Gemmatimonas sp.]|nr:hypothetical protein [Gemmatimonas sp.]
MTRSRRSGNALVLVGHGSHLSPDSSAPVYAHAAEIRRRGVFDEVLEVFWKEEPCLRDALDLLESENVWIVPIFLAEGYFTRQVLPRELGLGTDTSRRALQTVHYCPPVGTHPMMADMILRRAREVSGLTADERRESALVVVGHGTDRSASSGDTVYSLVERLRALGEFGHIVCGFLDESPAIGDVVRDVDVERIVLVPFFVAEGWHTRTTIPDELGLQGDLTVEAGRRIWYSPPIGTLDDIADVILSIAAEAGASLRAESPRDPPGPKLLEESPIAEARNEFFQWLGQAGSRGRTFLQVLIRPTAAGRFEVRHLEDADLPLASLTPHRDPPAATPLARSTQSGAFRPLRSAANLARGWVFLDLDATGLWTTLSNLYPAAVLHWHRGRTGDLRTVSYDRWASRQSGIYSGLRDLPSHRLAEMVDACCHEHRCLRSLTWGYSLPVVRGPLDHGAVPCLEPCTLFAAVARDKLVSIGSGQPLAGELAEAYR